MFRRSAAGYYKDRARGLGALLRVDSNLLRVIIFIAMSVIFFFFLKITERKIPHGLVPDSTLEQTTQDTSAMPDTVK